VGCLRSAEVTAVVHAVVKDTNDQYTGLVRLEEDAVTAAGGHLDPGLGSSRLRVIAVPLTRPFIVSRRASM
jgi:hypothetical protein